MKCRVGLTQQEERFFYEYLRVAGDRSPSECARDISNTLGTKTPNQILNFYQETVDLIYKDKTSLAKENHRRTHRILTKFYDTRVAPARQQKQQHSGEVSEKSPNDSKKHGNTMGCSRKKSECGHEITLGHEADVTSQLQSAPFLEILFVPFEEDLANTLASSGYDPCPRLKFSHNEKITSVVDQLQNTWDRALKKLGQGGVRLKAPDDSAPALRACAWGDPGRDHELTLFDLMNALRLTSPSTLGYTWEHQPPQTASPQDGVTYTGGKLTKCYPEVAAKQHCEDRNDKIGNIKSDSISLVGLSSSNVHTAANSGVKRKNDGTRLNRMRMGLTKSIQPESRKRTKASYTQSNKRESKSAGNITERKQSEVKPEQIVRNAWAQYADVIKQCNYLGAKGPQDCGPRQQNPIFTHPIELTDRERSILEFIRKEENLGVAFETLRGISSPKGRKTAVQTPNSGKNKSKSKDWNSGLIDEMAGLSPPSSFKLPPEFHRVSGNSGTPIRSLCGIFDSCQPLSPVRGKLSKPGAQPREVSQLPEEFLNPTMSLLSLLDGISNSHWVNKLDEEKEQCNTLGNRPFAKLFDG